MDEPIAEVVSLVAATKTLTSSSCFSFSGKCLVVPSSSVTPLMLHCVVKLPPLATNGWDVWSPIKAFNETLREKKKQILLLVEESVKEK